MIEYLIINDRIRIPRDRLRFTYVRSSGPGGQNVNKVNSKAVLRWAVRDTVDLPTDVRDRFLVAFRRRISDEGVLVVTSQRYRDAPRNADDCLNKLCAMVQRIAEPPKRRRPSRPTRGSVERRLREKQAHSNKKRQRRKSLDSEE